MKRIAAIACRDITRGVLAVLVCAVLCVCAFGSKEACAYYENPTMSTTAQVQTDNSLHVTTQRSYAFDEEYSLLTIPLSRAADESTLSVGSVRLIQVSEGGEVVSSWRTLEEVRFQSAWRELFEETKGVAADVEKAAAEVRADSQSGGSADSFFTLPDGDAFALDSRNDRIYVFMQPASLNTVVEFDYVIEQACTIYEDVAELYWDYVSPWLDADTGEVKAQIQLPVPEGTSIVLGETVRAWGHGPEGSFDIGLDGTVDYLASDVRSGQFAQAHVIFPTSWLSNISFSQKLKKGGIRAEGAISGEASWTDTYTAGLVNSYLVDAVQVAICILLLAGAVVVYALRGRERAVCGDALGGERVANAHGNGERGNCKHEASVGEVGACEPCACGGVERGIDSACMPGERSIVGEGWFADSGEAAADAENPAGAMGVSPVVLGRLLRGNQWSGVDFAAELESLSSRGVITIEDTGDDARFRVTPAAKSYELSELDRKAMELAFDVVGDGYQSVSVGDVESACSREPSRVGRAMEEWHRLLDAQVEGAEVFDARSKRTSIRMVVVALVAAAVAIFELLMLDKAVAWALLLTSLAVLVVAMNVPRRTPLGCAVAARSSGDAVGEPAWTAVLAKALEGAMINVSDECE